jgi:hypothetical protein
MNAADRIRLFRMAALSMLIWFGPSILVLQTGEGCGKLGQFSGALFGGQLQRAATVAALLAIVLVALTIIMAYRCDKRSNKWIPLGAAFFFSCLLWAYCSALFAAG